MDDFEESLTNFGTILDSILPQLTETEGEDKKSVFTSLTVLRNTSFEFTSTTSNDKSSAADLRSTSNCANDRISMAKSISKISWGFEITERNINSYTHVLVWL
jgi:hypothetical protein